MPQKGLSVFFVFVRVFAYIFVVLLVFEDRVIQKGWLGCSVD